MAHWPWRNTLLDLNWRHNAGYLLVLALVCWSQPGLTAAQNSSASYRQTLLSIQQQIEANNPEAARALIASTRKQYPADGGLENLLGVVEIQQGNIRLARKAFALAISHDPQLVSAYLNLSRIDMETAVTDLSARGEALRLSEKAAQLQPDNDEANYQIATILAWGKSYQRSLDHLAKLSAKAQAEVGAEALACSNQAALGHSAAAVQAAAALAANPDLTEQDANTCLPPLRAAHRADLIDTIFAAAGTRQPLSPAGLRILGLAQEAESHLEEARATLERAYAADDKSVVVLEDLARVARTAKDEKGALGYLAHARELQPNDPSLPYLFGAICLDIGLYAESLKAMTEAVKLAPDNAEYNLGLGTVVSYGPDPAKALPYLTKYHSLRPQDPAGALAIGATYFRAKDYETAAKWLKQSVSNRKSAVDAHFYLGQIARQEGRRDEAIDELKQSLALRPDQPDVLAELGQIHVSNRNYPEATTCLNRALELDRDNYAANFGLLELYARTGDTRREQQSKRFEEIKNKREEWDRNLMRVIEIRHDGTSSSPE